MVFAAYYSSYAAYCYKTFWQGYICLLYILDWVEGGGGGGATVVDVGNEPHGTHSPVFV